MQIGSCADSIHAELFQYEEAVELPKITSVRRYKLAMPHIQNNWAANQDGSSSSKRAKSTSVQRHKRVYDPTHSDTNNNTYESTSLNCPASRQALEENKLKEAIDLYNDTKVFGIAPSL